jgi:hypothetical protein
VKLSHTYAPRSCFNCKKFSYTPEGSPNWSRTYLLVAVAMAVPLWVFLTFFRRWLPWYDGLDVLAGELLLFYVGGLVSGLISIFRRKPPTVCPECSAPLLTTGRYFKDSAKPVFDDFVIIGVFAGANVAFWIAMLR